MGPGLQLPRSDEMVVIFKETHSAPEPFYTCLTPVPTPPAQASSSHSEISFSPRHARLRGRCEERSLLQSLHICFGDWFAGEWGRGGREWGEWVGKERWEQGSQRTCDARLTYCHHDNRHHFTGAALRMPVWAEVTELKVGFSLLWVPQRTDPLLQCSPHLLFYFCLIPSTALLKGALLLLTATCGDHWVICTSCVQKWVLPIWLS